MSNIIERLRKIGERSGHGNLMRQAADEIEKQDQIIAELECQLDDRDKLDEACRPYGEIGRYD